MPTLCVSVLVSLFLAWPLKMSIRKSIDCRVLSVSGEMFASALQMLSPAHRSASVSVIVGWVRYLCLKNTVWPTHVLLVS